jgi:hypothetical protein
MDSSRAATVREPIFTPTSLIKGEVGKRLSL